MKEILDAALRAGVSAVIVSDMAAVEYAASLGLEIHISVQANISNRESLRFFSNFADVAVLARELSISRIKEIADFIAREDIRGPSGRPMKIEIFVHGALCAAVSGRCYMSLGTYNYSANRGACLQNCRRAYRIIDEQTGDELLIGNKYVMSPKDLCTVRFMDKIIESGASVLKIEGRGRSADYVYTTVKVYRETVDSVLDGTFSEERIQSWMKELNSVFNRGFWEGGYYLGEKMSEWCGIEGSKASLKKTHIGRIIKFFPKISIAELELKARGISEGARLLAVGTSTGAVRFEAKGIRKNGIPVQTASKGDTISVSVPEKVRRNDIVYILEKREFGQK
jgi:putative protease